jgi:nucleoside-diphosphate-sugar epimerase
VKVLLTGATGFVGTALRAALKARSIPYRSVTHQIALRESRGEAVSVGSIDGATEWSAAVTGVSSVVHLAARVHVMRETLPDALAAFRSVNTQGTERLARAAVRAGARRFIYVSSIKVNGESTSGRPFSRSDPPGPVDPYGISKWEAELALARVARETGLEVVVVRPPLVYGPGVRGNFLRLLKLARLGFPTPVGSANNLRSLVFVRSLADVLVTCIQHPAAAGQTFLVSDGEDLSTPALFTKLARALGKRPWLVPVPVGLLRAIAGVARRSAEFQRLFGSLQVDSTPLLTELGWRPPHTVDQGILETASWYCGRS